MLSKRVPPFKTVGRSVRRFQCIWPLSCIAGNVGISQKRHDGHDFPEHSLSMSLFTTYQNHSLLYLDFFFFFIQLVPCFTYIVKAFISALLLADKYQFKTRNNWFLLGAAEQAINTAQQIPEGNVCLFSCQVCHYVHDHWNGENRVKSAYQSFVAETNYLLWLERMEKVNQKSQVVGYKPKEIAERG